MQFLHDLNQQQLEAVTHSEGPLLVLAGAGTGKTKVLTCRIAYLINKKIASEHQIIAVTFTNKASKEMQERIEKLTDNASVTAGTFHALCSKIVRMYAPLLGMRSDFTILDTEDQTKLIKATLIELGLDVKEFVPKNILRMIARWKDAGFTVDKVAQMQIHQHYAVAARVYPLYQRRCLLNNCVDFSDLILYSNRLFTENNDILQQESHRRLFLGPWHLLYTFR